MPLHPNNELLVKTVEAMGLLDNRYEQMKFVNYDSVSDQKRGCFSLVFRAFDRLNQKTVALKFYDIDPQRMMDVYRQKAFQREHEILSVLLNKKRCLQLASALSTFQLELQISNVATVTIPCQYFAIEWIDDDIDEYFLANGTFTHVQKLRMFNDIVLAVASLHRFEIYHRDIKADNLRAYKDALERIVVAIDLGTAAIISSGHLTNSYTHSVGAPIYAASEARCGLAGNRFLAPFTDKYALGCLLYELFNPDYFYRELTRHHPNYETTLSAMSSFLLGAKNEQDQLDKWKIAVAKIGHSIAPLSIDGPGNTIPLGIVDLLNELLAGLTHINYSKRPTLDWTRQKIHAAIKVLENSKAYQHKLEIAKTRRLRRQDNADRAQARLSSYLKGKK